MGPAKDYKEKVLEFDPFDGDFGEQGDTILSDKIVKARKERKCSHCSNVVAKGEYVRSMSAKFDGELMSYTWCSACCDLMHTVIVSEDADDEEYDMDVLYRKWDRRARGNDYGTE